MQHAEERRRLRSLRSGQKRPASERGVRPARVGAYFEAALDCVIMADASGRVVEFNPAAERTFGYSA